MAGSGGNGRVSPTPEVFRGLAGHLVTGVSVVVGLAEGEPVATTAGSVVAASWEPPLLAVFFRAGSRTASAIDESRRFTVNILGETDSGLARRFARPERGQGWSAFGDVEFVRRDPAPPVLAAAAAWADCLVTRAIPFGDHTCYSGQVIGLERRADVPPLVFYRGRLRGIGPSVAPVAWLEPEEIDLATAW